MSWNAARSSCWLPFALDTFEWSTRNDRRLSSALGGQVDHSTAVGIVFMATFEFEITTDFGRSSGEHLCKHTLHCLGKSTLPKILGVSELTFSVHAWLSTQLWPGKEQRS